MSSGPDEETAAALARVIAAHRWDGERRGCTHPCTWTSAAEDGGHDLHVARMQAEMLRERPGRVWVVREHTDKSEGRGRLGDVAVCRSVDEAVERNRTVCGVQGQPATYGGEIFVVELGSYPPRETRIYGDLGIIDGRRRHGWVAGHGPAE